MKLDLPTRIRLTHKTWLSLLRYQHFEPDALSQPAGKLPSSHQIESFQAIYYDARFEKDAGHRMHIFPVSSSLFAA